MFIVNLPSKLYHHSNWREVSNTMRQPRPLANAPTALRCLSESFGLVSLNSSATFSPCVISSLSVISSPPLQIISRQATFSTRPVKLIIKSRLQSSFRNHQPSRFPVYSNPVDAPILYHLRQTFFSHTPTLILSSATLHSRGYDPILADQQLSSEQRLFQIHGKEYNRMLHQDNPQTQGG